MGQIVKNIITGKKIKKPDPVDSGVPFDGGVMITETDKAGIITYANRKFREMTGYTKEELIGSPHNINRHPDMPKAGFQGMWDTIKSGEYWEGYVKNMRKDGQYYLVIVWVKPKFDDDGNIVGYIAGRKIPDKEGMDKALALYKQLKSQENPKEGYYTDEILYKELGK
jgi:PAS domain S-box-containing protein